jgi:hypothetical protein
LKTNAILAHGKPIEHPLNYSSHPVICADFHGFREHRRRVNDDLQDSPSLVSCLQEVLTICYGNAREQAADKTGLAIDTFPIDCPYPIAQILNPGFLPD